MNSVKYPQAKIQYKFDIEAPSSSSTFNVSHDLINMSSKYTECSNKYLISLKL